MTNLKNCSGKFITFEGIEGSGKTTQVGLLAEKLKDAGVDVVVTRDPDGTEITEEIRKILFKPHAEEMNGFTELLLYFSARAQHINLIIQPALKAGKCVICDRFTDATYAYQGGGRNMYFPDILALENMVQGTLRPDLTILLNAEDIAACLARAQHTDSNKRIASEESSFFERVCRTYLARAHGNPIRFKIVDAMQSIPEVEQTILKIVEDKFKAN